MLMDYVLGAYGSVLGSDGFGIWCPWIIVGLVFGCQWVVLGLNVGRWCGFPFIHYMQIPKI